VLVHRRGVVFRHDSRCPGAALRAHCGERMHPLIAPVARRTWGEPRFAHTRVMVPCCPTRASSVNQTSTGRSAASGGRAAVTWAANSRRNPPVPRACFADVMATPKAAGT
jgi:hypothetical protein